MKKLETSDAETLLGIPYEPLSCVVEDLLPQGLHLLAGAPKIGKSWLALTAADASPKTVQRLRNNIGDLVDVLPTPLSMDRLAPLGRRPVAGCAVTDRNLAKLCYDRLDACGVIKHEEEMTE